MHECLLCKKNMSISKNVFGIGCLKNIYSFLEVDMPKKINMREKMLYKEIIKRNNIKNISASQTILLTDRYLTVQYLKKIPYGNYSKLIRVNDTDIQNIKSINKKEELKSSKSMSLNQAYNLYKKATKFTEGINKLKNGNFTDEESIKLLISSFSFIFNMQKNSSQYEKNTFKAMQYAFWQIVVEIGGKYAEFDISADLLQHSLEREPKDLLFTDGKVVKAIIEDISFSKTIDKIVRKYGKNKNEFKYDSDIDKKISMSFSESDLYFAIHNAKMTIDGKKQNDEWILDIILHDRYDYSRKKTLLEHYNDVNSVPKSIFSSTLYNLAYYSIKFGVMKEYDIDIHFKMNDNFEVIE